MLITHIVVIVLFMSIEFIVLSVLIMPLLAFSSLLRIEFAEPIEFVLTTNECMNVLRRLASLIVARRAPLQFNRIDFRCGHTGVAHGFRTFELGHYPGR